VEKEEETSFIKTRYTTVPSSIGDESEAQAFLLLTLVSFSLAVLSEILCALSLWDLTCA
jgi:hypothetical protein